MTDESPTIFPALFYRDAPAALDWLARAFGFQVRFVVPGELGTIAHAELSFGNGVIMLGSVRADQGWVSPLDLAAVHQVVSVYVADPDAHCARARAAGAAITHELTTADHGARGYVAKDPEGNHWYFGNYQPGDFWDQR